MGKRTGARQTLVQKVAEVIPGNGGWSKFVQVLQTVSATCSWRMI